MTTDNREMLSILFNIIGILIVFLIIFLIVRAIWRAIKRFTFELIDHSNGTSRPNYQEEARRACGKSAPKRKQDTTPPWEK